MTLLRNLKGMTSQHGNMPRTRTVVARFTSDDLGETLSLEASGVMILVNYADVADMVGKERMNARKKEVHD